MKDGFFGSVFDANGDGELTGLEKSLDAMAFAEMVISDSSSREEAEEKLADCGFLADDASDFDLCEMLDGTDYSEYF